MALPSRIRIVAAVVEVGGDDDLLADDLRTATQLSKPNIGQKHALLADDLRTATQLSKPTAAETGWSITDVDTDESIENGQVGVVVTINGTVAASGKKVWLEQGGTFEEQTNITGETAQTITFTVNYGALVAGAANLYVRNPL